MRIAFSGTANVGKSTLVTDFLNEWKNYKTPEKTYRELLKKYPHSKQANKEGQKAFLNFLLDDMQKYNSKDNVIFDRCPLDVLVYSLWCAETGSSDIDDDFIKEIIPIIRESMRLLDIIFFIPITKASPIPIEEDGTREVDPIYIEEIDMLFKALVYDYNTNFENTVFFPKDDSPGIIEIFGNREERIHLIRQYLDVNGELIGGEADSILTPENLAKLDQLIKEQKQASEVDQQTKKIIKESKISKS